MPEWESSYVIMWEFRVAAENVAEFERLYGRDGIWAHFFQGAEGFVRTELLRDTKQQGRYLTLDFWTSAGSYEAFRNAHAEEYAAIDARCEKITVSETEIGRFETVSV